MTDPWENEKAWEPMMEELVWEQRKSPKAKAVIRACVFHERKQIEAYSSMQGVIKRYSDTWTVTAPISQTVFAQLAMGDKLIRTKGAKEELVVQNVIKEDGEWIISVTSSTAMSLAL